MTESNDKVAEDKIKGAPISYYNAAKEAAITLGIDVATFGMLKAGKFLYTMWKSGKNPKEAAEAIADMAYNPQLGSIESLAQSQQTLAKQGTTMSPAELGQGGIAPVLDSLKIGRASCRERV